MKKFVSKQKNCFWTLFTLILVSEIMLTINNKIIQSIGIILTPIIVILTVLLMKNKKEEN